MDDAFFSADQIDVVHDRAEVEASRPCQVVEHLDFSTLLGRWLRFVEQANGDDLQGRRKVF